MIGIRGSILMTLCAVAATVVLVVFVALGYVVEVNNQLVVLDQNANEKWANVQNVYQRRADLVPSLVETVKGYARHERETLTEVVRARASATAIQATPELMRAPEALQRFQAAQTQFAGALARLLVVLEKYPKLQADEGFRALQQQLEATENRITVERQRYNAAILDYNTRVGLFPGAVVAERIGFRSRPFFAAEANAQRAPKVSFP